MPADIRYSDWDCALTPGNKNTPQLRLGLRLIKGLGWQTAERITNARASGTFADAQDLYSRAQLNRRELAALIAVDGVMESDGEVYHLIARQVHNFDSLMKGLKTRSRDFC